MDKFQQEEHGRDAVEELVAWYTAGVVAGSGDQKWQGIGTGCAVSWNGRFFILTADHVIRDTDPKDLRFFFRAPGKLNRAEREALLSLKGVSTSSLMPFGEAQIGDIIRANELDLAAVPVNQPLETEKLVQFFPLSQRNRLPPSPKKE